MRTVYIDSEYHCHVENDGTMTAVQDAFFDGKCDAFIEGFCYEPRGEGAAVYPFQPFEELDAAQRTYEQQILRNSIPVDDLQAAYREGVISA